MNDAPANEPATELLARGWGSYSDEWEKRYPTLAYLGAEWIGANFCKWIMDEYVKPYITENSIAIELGCGGGKFTQYLAPLCHKVIAMDISSAMVARAVRYLALQGVANVQYVVNDGKSFIGADPPVDLIFSYDVFLHLPIELVYAYLVDGRRVLSDDGVFILHQQNILFDKVMDRMVYQAEKQWWEYPLGHPDTIGRMFFTTPDVSKAMAARAGYEVIKEGSRLERDILLALRKEKQV